MGSKTLMYQLGLKLGTYQKSILGKMAVQCQGDFPGSFKCIQVFPLTMVRFWEFCWVSKNGAF